MHRMLRRAAHVFERPERTDASGLLFPTGVTAVYAVTWGKRVVACQGIAKQRDLLSRSLALAVGEPLDKLPTYGR